MTPYNATETLNTQEAKPRRMEHLKVGHPKPASRPF